MTLYRVNPEARTPGARITTETIPEDARMTVMARSALMPEQIYRMEFMWDPQSNGQRALRLAEVQPPITDDPNDGFRVLGDKIVKREKFELISTEGLPVSMPFIAASIEANIEPVTDDATA